MKKLFEVEKSVKMAVSEYQKIFRPGLFAKTRDGRIGRIHKTGVKEMGPMVVVGIEFNIFSENPTMGIFEIDKVKIVEIN